MASEGAVGVGWELGVMGLYLHASIAFGAPEDTATAAGVRTTAFYTGADTGAG
ncbi:hypothetical protein O4328_27735 [Rhodococcus opacus]|uniref:Uncharacterized protein n=1 Tax=Rhodococcus opacus TaxID=37919 RepID=A0AAX3YM65_RHOOP|nr:hypothetical protein [Rhodococcus opacus]MCZ4587432.1 hypothetical protein [Rhodococcus opacus]WLF49178.1 hypothetical protein Q5707_09405 [Rhodococcus opacus]